MQCIECKWFVGNVNDHYGICKRYPVNQNKTKTDFCGEYYPKFAVKEISISFQEPNEIEVKRGRKPKNVD